MINVMVRRAVGRVRGLAVATPVVDEAAKFRAEHDAWLAEIDARYVSMVEAMGRTLEVVRGTERGRVPDGLANAAWWKDRNRHARGERYVYPGKVELAGEYVVMVGKDGVDVAAYSIESLTEGKTELEVGRLFCTRVAPCVDRDHRDYNHHRCGGFYDVAALRMLMKPYRYGVRRHPRLGDDGYYNLVDLRTNRVVGTEEMDKMCCVAFNATGWGWRNDPKV